MYELLKQCKDAGFPQTGLSNLGVLKDETDHSYGVPYPTSMAMIYKPTLEEAIEACGDGFYDLTKFSSIWSAFSTRRLIEERGPTPLEAVLRLWLELHKI